jgi:5-methylcytosine-specific restriction endonuclease McrA
MRERRADPVENEKVRAARQRYSVSDKRRSTRRAYPQFLENAIARSKGRGLVHDLSRDEWEQIMDAFGRRCAYCRNNEKVGIDHFIPLSDPACPGTVFGNAVPACRSCNASKRNKRLEEWRLDTAKYVLSVLHGLS